MVVGISQHSVDLVRVIEYPVIGEIALGVDPFRLGETEVGGAAYVVDHILPVVHRLVLMRFRLVVGIADRLPVGKALDRKDVQFKRDLRLEPFDHGVRIIQSRVRDDVVVVRLASPDVVASDRIRIVRRSGRVVQQSLSEICPLGVSVGLTVIHIGPDLQPAVEHRVLGVEPSTVVLSPLSGGYAILLLVEERRVHTGLLGSEIDGDIVLLGEIPVVDGLVPPVGAAAVVLADTIGDIFFRRHDIRFGIGLPVKQFRTVGEIEFPLGVGAALGRD